MTLKRPFRVGARLAVYWPKHETPGSLTPEEGTGAVRACQEATMGIIAFLVFGLVVGFIARAVMPGSQKMGLLATMLLGVVGSFVGGFIGALITDSRVLDLNTAGLIGSVVGSLIALAVAGGGFGRRLHA